MSKEKTKKQAALETLWFMQDYGNIISAFALAKTVESFGASGQTLIHQPTVRQESLYIKTARLHLSAIIREISLN